MFDAKQFASDKILSSEHLPRVIEWLKGENPFPITMELDITNVCNHKCPACSGGFNNDKTAIGKEEGIRLIREISALGCKAITFTGGGEPFCNPFLEYFILEAHDCGLDIGLITNGHLLNTIDAKSLFKCTWIRISLDAGTPEMHKAIHGTNDFNLIVNNILELIKEKDLFIHTDIGIGYLVGNGTDNFNDMMDFVNLALNIKVDYAQFRPFHTQAKKDFSNFKKIDFTPFIEKSNATTKILYSQHKFDNMANGSANRNYNKCYGQQFAGIITANEDMTVCCHTRGLSQYTLGNVKTESIKKIWNSSKRKKIVETINIDKCPLLCRCNTINECLWNIKKTRKHINFL